MSFQEIKAGDKVLCLTFLRYGFGTKIFYWIQKTVTRTTDTQIIIEKEKFYKEDGRQVGDSWNQIYHLYTKIEDQTEQYLEDVAKFKKIVSILRETEKLMKSLNDIPTALKTLSVAELENTVTALNSVNKKLEPTPKTPADQAKFEQKYLEMLGDDGDNK